MRGKLERIKFRLVDKFLPYGYYNKQQGYCPICERSSKFIAFHNYLRDNLKCVRCHSLPRERALMTVINDIYPNWRELKIHESSPIKRGVSEKFMNECIDYTPSQFFPNKPFGEMVQGFINQDLENQTFGDKEFDLVVTQDVFEHVFNPKEAFAEVSRTLKKGGRHIFNLPLINHFHKSEVWAKYDKVKKETIFIGEPEYHGNPVDSNGSLVTMHWGGDIVDFIKNATNGDMTEIIHIENMGMGISGELVEVFVTQKN